MFELLYRLLGMRSFPYAAAMLLTLTSPLLKADLLDQSNIEGPLGNLHGGLHWQQEITAGMDGLLTKVALYSFMQQTITMGVTPGSGFQTGPFAFSASVTLNGPTRISPEVVVTYVDVSAAHILLSKGDVFVLQIRDSTAGCCAMVSRNQAYPQGRVFLQIGNNPPTTPRNSLPFQTYMQPVPEAGEVATLVLALPGVLAVLRRRVRRT